MKMITEMERRDLIERLMERCGEFLRAAAGMRAAGAHAQALARVRAARALLLDGRAGLADRLAPASVIEVLGPEVCRVAAALLAEEALILVAAERDAEAVPAARRAADLLDAMVAAGVRLGPGERERLEAAAAIPGVR